LTTDCESSHYGYQCAQLCNCQNQGICNPVDGSCHCQPGWSGQFCDQSKTHFKTDLNRIICTMKYNRFC